MVLGTGSPYGTVLLGMVEDRKLNLMDRILAYLQDQWSHCYWMLVFSITAELRRQTKHSLYDGFNGIMA